MPLPEGLTKANRLVFNRLTKPFAARLPWMGVLHHIGRRSGKSYETPMLAWRHGHTVIVALFYGEEVDWLRNVSDNTSSMETRGERFALGPPTIVDGTDDYPVIPRLMRKTLRAIDVNRFAMFPIV